MPNLAKIGESYPGNCFKFWQMTAWYKLECLEALSDNFDRVYMTQHAPTHQVDAALEMGTECTPLLEIPDRSSRSRTCQTLAKNHKRLGRPLDNKTLIDVDKFILAKKANCKAKGAPPTTTSYSVNPASGSYYIFDQSTKASKCLAKSEVGKAWELAVCRITKKPFCTTGDHWVWAADALKGVIIARGPINGDIGWVRSWYAQDQKRTKRRNLKAF